MADDELTPSECAVLIVLMAEAREIYNPDLKERYGIDLSGDTRRKLNRLRLVATRKVGRGNAHQLDDKGWVRVHEELDFASPRARALGGAVAALHANLRDRVLPRCGPTFGDLFGRSHEETPAPEPPAADPPAADPPAADPPAAEPPVAEPSAVDLEDRIREAYTTLAREPGAWVSLTRLRPLFPDVQREQLDEALRRLNLRRDVNIVPESNQKTLTAADRDAAVRIGAQDKHLLAIGVR
jgi:broad specificity phosphatase PhoE